MVDFFKRNKVMTTVAAALIILGIVASAWFFLTRSTKEDALYNALLMDAATLQVPSVEESTGNADATLTATGVLARDDIIKSDASIACSAESPDLGTISLKMTMHQIDTQVFFRFDEFGFSNSGDPAWEQETNETLKALMVDKWVLARDEDKHTLGYKEHGVVFGVLGAYSKNMDSRKIIELLKKHKVITVLNTTEVTQDGKTGTEYTLLVRRSAYEKFMDSVAPGFPYKNDTLDTLFEGDTSELTVVIGKDDSSYARGTYTMENICRDFISEIDQAAADSLPKRIKIQSYTKPDSTVADLQKPAQYMTEDEFDALFAEE